MLVFKYSFLLLLLSSTQASPQMERMGQPITDAYTNIGGVRSARIGVEERVYPARKWVCTKKISRVGDSDAKSGMFWSLFKYIQGANSGEVKIDMTTPVTTMVEEDIDTDNLVYEMCFYIGEAHQSNPPTPSNTRVYIKEEEERKIFTRKVGGWMDSEKWVREAEELKVVLAKKGFSFSNESLYQVGYDAPSKVWNRRNEVWFFSLQ